MKQLLLTDYLERTAASTPQKTAYVSETRTFTISQFREEAMKVAQGLISLELFKKPVAVMLPKSVECITSVVGVAYSGNFYTVIDTEMPSSRIRKIFSLLQPGAVIICRESEALLRRIQEEESENPMLQACEVLIYEELMKADPDPERVLAVTSHIMPNDVVYVLFTSGSTGIPKGVVTSHGALAAYMSCWEQAYHLCKEDRLLDQAPFYFVMSLMDMFSPIVVGTVTHIVPDTYYSFPALLVKYIEKHRITTLNWVPSALSSFVDMNAFELADLSSINKILFGGEVMPMRVIREWRKRLPGIFIVNGYGSTEVTDGCLCYMVNRDFPDGKTLPIGKPNPNMEVFLLDENNQAVREPGREGEICVRSPSLSYGYYNDPERTRAVFVQNPLNSSYPETIYRTGDLGILNQDGDFEYMGRKDHQIKYMGHRIELGEIEANVLAVPGVAEASCLYDAEKKHILLYFSGKIDSKELGKRLRETLPVYMLPRMRIKLDKLPRNAHGKIDRRSLALLD